MNTVKGKQTRYYTKVLGVVMEIKPVAYDPNLFPEQGGSVFCQGASEEDTGLTIRLTPSLISTKKKGFDERGFSRQHLRKHFAATLPLPPQDETYLIQEVPTVQQIEAALKNFPTSSKIA